MIFDQWNKRHLLSSRPVIRSRTRSGLETTDLVVLVGQTSFLTTLHGLVACVIAARYHNCSQRDSGNGDDE